MSKAIVGSTACLVQGTLLGMIPPTKQSRVRSGQEYGLVHMCVIIAAWGAASQAMLHDRSCHTTAWRMKAHLVTRHKASSQMHVCRAALDVGSHDHEALVRV